HEAPAFNVEFECGEFSESAGHFKFETRRQITFPFKDGNRIASNLKVSGYEWDAYRFRNAATGDWLTACVGHERSGRRPRSVLRIMKGDVFADVSFPLCAAVFQSLMFARLPV
ncbi:hypothetical protein AAVH_42517, partial [Aphelenchoides avenae]